jgi:MFS family permease
MEKRTRIIVTFVYFMAFMGIALPYPIMTPMFLNGVLLSPFSAEVGLGIALAVYPLGLFLGGGILGSYSDKHGRRPVLLVSLVITTLGTVWSGWAILENDFWQLVVSRIVTGFFEANGSIARAMLIDMEKGKSKASSFALLSVGGYGGYLFGPVLGGYLAAWGNAATPFLVAGLMGLTALVLAFLWLPETNARILEGQPPRARPSLTAMLRGHSIFRQLLLAQFLLTIGINTFYQFYPLMLTSRFGAGSVMIAQMNMFFTGSMILFAVVGVHRLERYVPLGKKLIMGGVSHAVLMLAILAAATPLVGVVIATFIGFAVAIMNAALPAFLSRETPELEQGAVMGAMTSSFCLAQAFISVFGGWLASGGALSPSSEGASVLPWGLENWTLTFVFGSFATLAGVAQIQKIRRRMQT